LSPSGDPRLLVLASYGFEVRGDLSDGVVLLLATDRPRQRVGVSLGREPRVSERSQGRARVASAADIGERLELQSTRRFVHRRVNERRRRLVGLVQVDADDHPHTACDLALDCGALVRDKSLDAPDFEVLDRSPLRSRSAMMVVIFCSSSPVSESRSMSRQRIHNSGLDGLFAVDRERLRVEIETRCSDDWRAACSHLCPVWDDQDELLRLLDPAEGDDGRFHAPGYHQLTRYVVEAGQVLGQAIGRLEGDPCEACDVGIHDLRQGGDLRRADRPFDRPSAQRSHVLIGRREVGTGRRPGGTRTAADGCWGA